MISKVHKFEINCDVCEVSVEWVTADTQKQANYILVNQTDWKIEDKKHKCPDCVKNAKSEEVKE